MSEATPNGILLRDGRGVYYLITPEMLEAARLPDNMRAGIETELAGRDTAGYGLNVFQAWPALNVVSPRDPASGQATGKRR